MNANGTTLTLRTKLFWVSVLYFAEGLPFGIVYDVLPVYFRQHGVSLKEIGFMFFLTLPWTVKVFWSPLVDRFGERRTWVTLCCAAMASVMIAIPLFDAAHPALAVWALLLMFTIASASQDIAIDAYAIGLVAKGEEGVTNGYRLALYRVAVLLGGGGTMYLVRPLGWTWVFLLIGFAFVALAFVSWLTPSVPVVHQPPREWARQFVAFLRRPGSLAVFAFILIYRTGDLVMGPMVKPFWVDRGMSTEEIGTISTIAGTVLGIIGTLIGGWVASRVGIFHALWSLGLVQALSNLGYAGVAQFDLGRPWLYSASCFESLTFGMGTGAFFAFLMRICDKRQAATQYALLTSLVGLNRFFGGWSGVGVETFGYAGFFVLTFLIALPAYALLPWVRRWIGNGDGPSPEPASESSGTPGGGGGSPLRRGTPAPASAR
ncbi:MAG: MFS transporter [Candidatus Polarisedimenticolia bacterium]